MFLAYYLHDLSPFLIQFGDGFGLRWYGLAYVVAFLAGYGLYRELARRGYADLPVERVGDFMTWWVVLGTLIGGRLGYMLFYQWSEFMARPWTVFQVWEGGMSAHGGMLGVIVATWIYARLQRISWLNLGDNLVVAAPLGLFFGRLANFINGELFGRATTVPWAVLFPKELYDAPALYGRTREALLLQLPPGASLPSLDQIIAQAGTSPLLQEILPQILTPRHPSQLYQALGEGLFLFVLLWLARTRLILPNGALTGFFFIGYGILRSVGEIFREPDAPLTWILTRGQFLSVFALIIGVAFCFVAWQQKTYPLHRRPPGPP